MFDLVLRTAKRLLGPILRGRAAPLQSPELPGLPRAYQRLQRVVLAEEVSRTLFQEYAAHRASGRGEEEIGWVLLGEREVDHAVVMATLPAGARRDAGAAHVMFDSNAQAVATRLLRQHNKRLVMLGVAHTHPGNLRHPSGGDYAGDSLWVGQLRGGQGIFGIGTADGQLPNGPEHGIGSKGSAQVSGKLMMSWFVLGAGDHAYTSLEVKSSQGPDLALPLRNIWETIEEFADALERLCIQQAGVVMQLVSGQRGPALAVTLKLAEPGSGVRLVLEEKKAAFYWQRGPEMQIVEPPEGQLDRRVYLLLAELTGRSMASH